MMTFARASTGKSMLTAGHRGLIHMMLLLWVGMQPAKEAPVKNPSDASSMILDYINTTNRPYGEPFSEDISVQRRLGSMA